MNRSGSPEPDPGPKMLTWNAPRIEITIFSDLGSEFQILDPKNLFENCGLDLGSWIWISNIVIQDPRSELYYSKGMVNSLGMSMEFVGVLLR